ncbi:MAG: PAS domain S-box protein, partial [Bacteroidota bacterium]
MSLLTSVRSLKFFTAFFTAIVLLTVIGLFTFRTVLNQAKEYKLITQSHAVTKGLEEIRSSVIRSQTELRTYFLTSNAENLKHYYNAVDTVDQMLTVTGSKLMTGEQKSSMQDLIQLIRRRELLNTLKTNSVAQDGYQIAERKYPISVGQRIIQKIDSVITVMEAREEENLQLEYRQSENQTEQTLLLISVGGISSIVLIIIIFLFLNREIQQRTKIEKQIRDSETRVVSFLEAVPAGVYILTADGRPLYANEEAKKILGQGLVPDATGDTMTEIYQAYVQGTSVQYPSEKIPIVRALNGERSIISDIEIWRPDRVVPLFVTGAPIYDSEGKLQYAMAAFVDISVQKSAEQKLADSEERYRQFIENATDIIYRTDHNGRMTYVNPVGLRMFGYSEEESIGMHYTDVVAESERNIVKKFYLRQILSKTET